jgi:hypothetical protein
MSTNPATPSPDDSDSVPWKYGIRAVALGLGTILAAALIVLWRDPNGAASTLGIVISPITAVIGAYLGVHVSSTAAKDALDRAATAERDKTKALADRATVLGALDPQAANELSPRLHFQP